MDNVVERYLRQVEKALKIEPATKNKIISDLRCDINNLIANGLTAEEAINKMGLPKEIAEGFNRSYLGYRGYKYGKYAKALARCSAAAAVICLLVGFIGKSVYMASGHAAVIGGADGPTAIYIRTEPFTALVLFDWFIKFAAVAFVFAAVFCVCCLFAKHGKKGK